MASRRGRTRRRSRRFRCRERLRSVYDDRRRRAWFSRSWFDAYCVRRAVATAVWNRAVMADEMSPPDWTSKNSPGDAHACMFVAICGWNVAMPRNEPYPVWYQLLVGSGRYSVYRTAMRMPRFLMVVHHVVLNGCWQRVPPE